MFGLLHHVISSYKSGDYFTIERFYITEIGKGICIHALCSILTLLSPFIKGVIAKILEVGEEDTIEHVRYLDF